MKLELRRVKGAILFLAFIATVYGANWSLTEFGFVSVGFGLLAPAGVFFAGLAFTCRDLLHETAGRMWVLTAILIGALLSWSLEDAGRIALASGVAFGISELADLSIYEPLRRRGWLRAVLASNVVGFTLDSILFLWIAFGSLAYIEGQLLGKGYMTLAAIAALWSIHAVSVRVRAA